MTRNNQVHVKFFALFREMIGRREDWAELTPGLTVGALWEMYTLQARNPRVTNIRAAFAVNSRLAAPDTILEPGDEVGFLPPVSGGEKGRVKAARSSKKSRRGHYRTPKNGITKKALSLATLIRRVQTPDAGAIVTFSGVVRNNSRGMTTRYLEYEAYKEMAIATFSQIESEAQGRWKNIRMAMAHRVGRLEIGEASVMIAVSAPHRAEAFAACRFAIERIKATLPVWKKEFTSENDYWVEGPLAGEKKASDADDVVRSAEKLE